MDGERTFVDRVSILISRVTMWMVAVIVAIIAYEVVMRYFFNSATLWVNELSLWLGGMSYLFAGLYAMQQRAHIRITALYDLAPRNLQRVFDLISTTCVVLFAAGVAIGGWTSAMNALMRWERFGTAWDPPIPATMKPLVLLVSVLVAIQAVNNLVVDWRKPKPPRPTSPGVD